MVRPAGGFSNSSAKPATIPASRFLNLPVICLPILSKSIVLKASREMITRSSGISWSSVLPNPVALVVIFRRYALITLPT